MYGIRMSSSCSEHRQGLLLLSIRQRLAEGDLPLEEKLRLEEEVRRLEAELALD